MLQIAQLINLNTQDFLLKKESLTSMKYNDTKFILQEEEKRYSTRRLIFMGFLHCLHKKQKSQD